MSSLVINWRFGGWFLQIDHPRHWRYGGACRLTHLRGRPAKGEAMFAIYQGRVHFALTMLLLVVAILWLAS